MGDRGSIGAIQTDQIRAGEGIGLQEAVDAGKLGATHKISDLYRVAIEIAAAIALHGCGIGSLSENRPAPAIDGFTRICHRTRDGLNQAPSGCFVVGNLINDKTAREQPTFRKSGSTNGPIGRLTQGHEAGPAGIRIGLQLGPEFNGVRNGWQARTSNQAGGGYRLAVIDSKEASASAGIVRVDGRNDRSISNTLATDHIANMQVALG